MKSFIRFTAMVAMILAPCSCATMDTEPGGMQVSLVNLSAQEATVLETTMLFTVRLDNEQPEPVQLSGAVHKIYINGAYIGQGMVNETVEVPRLSSATQIVTVHLRNWSMASRIRALIESKRFEYRIDSVLYGGRGARRMKVSNQGVLGLNDFQPSKK